MPAGTQPDQPDAPPGWSNNPSSWAQRLPIVGLAMVGFAVASSLALYQWRIVPSVWEPFFGEGSRVVLNSGVSRVLPIPDAALGALSYLLDAITGAVGGTRRWRSMPWIVVLFGLAVGPLGVVSVERRRMSLGSEYVRSGRLRDSEITARPSARNNRSSSRCFLRCSLATRLISAADVIRQSHPTKSERSGRNPTARSYKLSNRAATPTGHRYRHPSNGSLRGLVFIGGGLHVTDGDASVRARSFEG